MCQDVIGSKILQGTTMATYRHSDLESLIDDFRMICEYSDGVEKQERLRQLYLKIDRSEIDKIYSIAESYMYNYSKVFGEPL